MIELNIDYQDEGTPLEGFYVYDETKSGLLPTILVAHDWTGRGEFACEKARKLAKLGYAAFALDMYGKNKIGHTKEEKIVLMQPLIQNRSKLLKRILTAFETVKKLDKVDATRIGAIGFCFGGLCVLDLARSGAEIEAVVSFHGLLNPPDTLNTNAIRARILALHGYNDPMVTPDQVMSFGEEMTSAKADWQLVMYGNAMHAFTNPNANDPSFGTVYNKTADDRSWLAMKAFFNETFFK